MSVSSASSSNIMRAISRSGSPPSRSASFPSATNQSSSTTPDTNSFATALWHRRYTGVDNGELARIAALRRCELYLLAGDEIPFVQDGLRDGETIRHQMHEWFTDALKAQPSPWLLMRESPNERLTISLTNLATCEIATD